MSIKSYIGGAARGAVLGMKWNIASSLQANFGAVGGYVGRKIINASFSTSRFSSGQSSTMRSASGPSLSAGADPDTKPILVAIESLYSAVSTGHDVIARSVEAGTKGTMSILTDIRSTLQRAQRTQMQRLALINPGPSPRLSANDSHPGIMGILASRNLGWKVAGAGAVAGATVGLGAWYNAARAAGPDAPWGSVKKPGEKPYGGDKPATTSTASQSPMPATLKADKIDYKSDKVLFEADKIKFKLRSGQEVDLEDLLNSRGGGGGGEGDSGGGNEKGGGDGGENDGGPAGSASSAAGAGAGATQNPLDGQGQDFRRRMRQARGGGGGGGNQPPGNSPPGATPTPPRDPNGFVKDDPMGAGGAAGAGAGAAGGPVSTSTSGAGGRGGGTGGGSTTGPMPVMPEGSGDTPIPSVPSGQGYRERERAYRRNLRSEGTSANPAQPADPNASIPDSVLMGPEGSNSDDGSSSRFRMMPEGSGTFGIPQVPGTGATPVRTSTQPGAGPRRGSLPTDSFSGQVGAGGERMYRPQYNLTQADLSDRLVGVVAGEAYTNNQRSVDAVINNILNRVGTRGYGPSRNMLQVATAPGQYAGFRRANQREASFIRERIRAIASGREPDITGGSNEYRAGWYNGPWGRRHADSPVIGGNRFAYNPRGGRGTYSPYDRPREGGPALRDMKVQGSNPQLPGDMLSPQRMSGRGDQITDSSGLMYDDPKRAKATAAPVTKGEGDPQGEGSMVPEVIVEADRDDKANELQRASADAAILSTTPSRSQKTTIVDSGGGKGGGEDDDAPKIPSTVQKNDDYGKKGLVKGLGDGASAAIGLP